MTDKSLLIHVDVDSPRKLLDFYRIKGVDYTMEELEKFYEAAFGRILAFFDKLNLKATFFVVGNELENSEAIRKIILQAQASGHEIENHTYSHPFGLATFKREEIISEIQKCSDVITSITGRKPLGFRSPGFSINNQIISILAELGFAYDSSGFWSVMNPILKSSHKLLFKNGLKNEGFGYVTSSLPQKPYRPDLNNWLTETKGNENFWELPLARTRGFALPFYHNFNLWAPSIYAEFASRNINRPCLVYLFHIIEFVDMSDAIPAELKVHPNLKTPLHAKLRASEKIISNLCARYRCISTREMLRKISGQPAGLA